MIFRVNSRREKVTQIICRLAAGCLLFGLMVTGGLYAAAQQRPLSYSLKLAQGVPVLPPANAQHWLDSLQAGSYKGTAQVWLQFYQIPDRETREKLAVSGIALYDYIPENTYVALLRFPLPATVPYATIIRSFISPVPVWKLSPQLAAHLAGAGGQGEADVMVSFIPGVSRLEMKAIIENTGGTIRNEKYLGYSACRASVPVSGMLALAAHDLIRSIGIAGSMELLNKDARSSSGAAYLQQAVASGGKGLDGTGTTIGVGDNSHALSHVDARDRVVNFNQAPSSMHGVHTTLTASGKGIMDPATQGMAPEARILNHFYELVWLQAAPLYKAYDMTITNNSYATVINDCNNVGLYDIYARMLDECGVENPQVLQVFAAGNDGLNICNGYPAGYATVNGGFQPAKNALIVGALDKNNAPWPKTSRGPVRDGRLKPDMTAYGYGIYSGDINDGYGNSNGTSMAAPVVAGCMALLVQRYKQLHGENPPAALLKALAMNGATDYGNPGPDFIYGYGLVNASRSVAILEEGHFRKDTLDQGDLKSFSITVPPGLAALKCMLYWQDAPGSELASVALVNNIDLEITGPDGTVHYPFVLDDSPAGVAAPATTGVDTKNNAEQIVLQHPLPGSYTVRIKGAQIPVGPQECFVVYDFLEKGLRLRFPVQDNPLAAGDSTRIYWDASEDPNSFVLEWSQDNGASWTLLEAGIPAAQRHYKWWIPENAATAGARVRLTRTNTGEQVVSGSFTISPKPVLQLSPVQCPGYIAIEWNSIPLATSYEVLIKKGKGLQPVDTVSGTAYIFRGLAQDSIYYVAVTPLLQGRAGYRSNALKRMPADGDCSGGISDGDLAVRAIVSPRSGRMATSTALTATETVSVLVINRDDMPADHYRVSCRVNNGPWQVLDNPGTIPANGSRLVHFPGYDLVAEGGYALTVAIENTAIPDIVYGNDTLRKTVYQLRNPPVDLFSGFTEDFEAFAGLTVQDTVMGIDPLLPAASRWDFQPGAATGRLRSFVHEEILIGGSRSLSLDLEQYSPAEDNQLTGTFHLASYDTAVTEARLEFRYKFHGTPRRSPGNEVWIRGKDTSPWIPFFSLDTAVAPGETTFSGSLSLTHAMSAAGQNFSASFQIAFRQNDTSCIAHNEYGNGMTIDDLRLYSVKNDVQLLAVDQPLSFQCGAAGEQALKVRVYNSDNLPQEDVLLFFRLNNGPVVADTLSYLAAKDTVLFHFRENLPALPLGVHSLDVWLIAAGDTYRGNDSILGFQFRNQPMITTFPYLEDFESGPGAWYAAGQNNSWTLGTPAGSVMKTAASGLKAWHTGGNGGNYFNREHSFLYSPCLDISGMKQPALSFSLFTHLEHCEETPCDLLYVEYSYNGIDWYLLTGTDRSTNWYNNERFQAWDEDQHTRWRVATAMLPPADIIQLRFVLKTDPGISREGAGIDDIHVYDYPYSIYEGPAAALDRHAADTGWVSFFQDSMLIASFHASEQPDAFKTLDYYRHERSFSPVAQLYHLPVSLAIRGLEVVAETRLFIADADFLRMHESQECDTCIKSPDAYRLGILRFHHRDPARENGAFLDNHSGTYDFIPFSDIRWVPYGNGYYAETQVPVPGELWFTAGMPGILPPVFSVYPNPVSGSRFYLSWPGVPGDRLNITVTDVAGRKFFETEAAAAAYDNISTIILPGTPAGVYFIRYRTAHYQGVDKIIVR